jgi:MoaA/NifB/PqqE/SkfB family radical SAM enzyme
MAGRLANAGLSRLYLSLDSTDAATHDAFRRRRGSHERVLAAITASVGTRLSTHLSTVLTAGNVDEIPRFALLADRTGLTGINFKRFRAAGNGLLSHESYDLTEQQEGQLTNLVAAARDAHPGLDISLNYGPEPGEVDSGCSCGIAALALRPNGDVSPCSYGETVIGNLQEQSLRELWVHSPQLRAMRAGSGCLALTPQRTPSNPYLHLASAT